MIARRAFLAAVAAAPALSAEAQTPLKIGWLSVSPHPFVADRIPSRGEMTKQSISQLCMTHSAAT